jgi:hypothetical protein
MSVRFPPVAWRAGLWLAACAGLLRADCTPDVMKAVYRMHLFGPATRAAGAPALLRDTRCHTWAIRRRQPQRKNSSIARGIDSHLAPQDETTISACPQHCLDLRQKLSRPSLFDCPDRLRIHPRRATVAAHSPPCFPQNVTSVDPVVQRMEPPRPTLLGTHI